MQLVLGLKVMIDWYLQVITVREGLCTANSGRETIISTMPDDIASAKHAWKTHTHKIKALPLSAFLPDFVGSSEFAHVLVISHRIRANLLTKPNYGHG